MRLLLYMCLVVDELVGVIGMVLGGMMVWLVVDGVDGLDVSSGFLMAVVVDMMVGWTGLWVFVETSD